MNIIKERLDVTQNFVTIDSPIRFYLQVNDDEQHKVLKAPQAIQIDCRKLLSKYYMPNQPAWVLWLIYDADLLGEGQEVDYFAHNVNFGDSIDSVDGELVKCDFTDLMDLMISNKNDIVDEIEEQGQAIVTALSETGDNADIIKALIGPNPAENANIYDLLSHEIFDFHEVSLTALSSNYRVMFTGRVFSIDTNPKFYADGAIFAWNGSNQWLVLGDLHAKIQTGQSTYNNTANPGYLAYTTSSPIKLYYTGRMLPQT